VASSVVDICNLALARLGDRATVASIDPPEGSAQADHCARFYPIARDVALEAHSWGFNTVRTSAPAVLVNPQPGWSFAYAKPDDCLRVLKVIRGSFANEWWAIPSEQFTRETEEMTGTEIVLTNVENATLVYQRTVEDTAAFPPQFVSALAWLLASYLAGPVVKGDAGRKAGQACYNAWLTESGKAATMDANQSKTRRQYQPEGMRARGYGGCTIPDAPIAGPYGFYAYPAGPGQN